MINEEVKQYLRDNLSISLTTYTEYDFGSEYTVVKVELSLGDEIISTSSDSMNK